MLNSRLGLFSVTTFRWFPFSLSYGVILPSSLTTLLPSACGFSPRLPVSVCGTGANKSIAAFLDSVGSPASLLKLHSASRFIFIPPDLPNGTDFALAPVFPFPGPVTLLCPHSSFRSQYRNFNLLSIGYGSRPRLRPRLTLSRLALPRNP